MGSSIAPIRIAPPTRSALRAACALVPRINAARDSGKDALFEALHLRSVVLNGANLLLAVATLVLVAMASPGLA